MAARAIWKAELVVGTERVPVKMYAAVEDRSIRFRLRHARDGARVRQRMAHPETGRTVEGRDAFRGVEVGRGRFVVLDEEELAGLEPEPSRDIELKAFLPPGALDPRWYERPYLLGPDEDGEERYDALAAALEESGREGLATWVLRKRFHAGALRAREGRLALVALRPAQEVLLVDELEAPAGRKLAPGERKLASQLVGALSGALSGAFDPAEYRDEYRDRVLALVEAKRRGETIELERFEPEAETGDGLAEKLEASLRDAG